MNIDEAYNEWAETYDSNQNFTRDLDAQLLRTILTSQRFESILEIGCGTGKNTGFLAQIGAQVDALDFSDSMIARAKEKVQTQNVRFESADLTQPWPCVDSAYELIVCSLVLEHIADLGHIFSEAARTLIAGGKFVINELHPFKQYGGTKARFEREAEIVEVPAFVHHISDFTNAAGQSDFKLIALDEHWHAEDKGKPPRIVSFVFQKR